MQNINKYFLVLICCSLVFSACKQEDKGQDNTKLEQSKIEDNNDSNSKKEISNVSWSFDSKDEDKNYTGENTVITFDFSDGTSQEFELDVPCSVDSMEMLDIDNDGIDDYVFQCYFPNTALEFNLIYAYSFNDGELNQIFPFTQLCEEAGDSLLDCEQKEIAVPSDYEKDNIVNAIQVSAIGKSFIIDTPKAYKSYTATAYCLDGQWYIKDACYKTYDKSFEEVAAELDIPDGAEIEYEDWVDAEHNVYRVALQRTEEDSDEYLHLMDYFLFQEEDGSVITIKVDYPSKDDDLDSNRYVGDVCDFDAEFVDVTFDGHKDLIISLGNFGAQGAAGHCAYVYEDGYYVYKKSFEDIPNYAIDEVNQCITGSSRGNAVTYYDYVYEYIDGDFVNTDTQETVYDE